MPTRLTLSKNSRTETTIRTSDNVVLYEVRTPSKHTFGTNPTVVYRHSGSRGAGAEIVGRLEMHEWSKNMVYYNGTTQPLSDLFPKKGWLSE